MLHALFLTSCLCQSHLLFLQLPPHPQFLLTDPGSSFQDPTQCHFLQEVPLIPSAPFFSTFTHITLLSYNFWLPSECRVPKTRKKRDESLLQRSVPRQRGQQQNGMMKVKEESEKVGLKLNIQKTKNMASGPITSWEIPETQGLSSQRIFRPLGR